MFLRLLLLLLLDKLALDKYLDLLADDPPAIEHHIECQAKILAVDLGFGTVANAVAHHIRVIEFPVLYHLQCNRIGIALNSQVTGQIVGILSCLFNFGAFEVHRWILISLPENSMPAGHCPAVDCGCGYLPSGS